MTMLQALPASLRLIVLGALGAALAPTSFGQVMEVGAQGVVVTSAPIRPQSPPPETKSGRAGPAAPPASLIPLLETAGREAELSTRLLEAVSYVESRFNPGARSPKGAIGLMQLMPGTAQDLGVDPADPVQNASGGAQYLRRMLELFDDNVELALAAYNAGPEAVIRHGGVPPFRETQEYVSQVMSYLAEISASETHP
ncbi:MAG: lytic transglycosylase domain-containing protein [Alphaproteobacteria bacterium]|nr:lytic transglycosylase domain-containing protein [Alphaproteobacteria bacterium]